jgi:hypothetical protein
VTPHYRIRNKEERSDTALYSQVEAFGLELPPYLAPEASDHHRRSKCINNRINDNTILMPNRIKNRIKSRSTRALPTLVEPQSRPRTAIAA